MKKKAQPSRPNNEDKVFHLLIIAYIALLVSEGALRKWVLPGLSDILLLARDPIVLLAYAWAISHNRFPWNKYTISGVVLMALCLLTALLFGHGNPMVAAFGFRANYLHIPFAFLIGMVWTRSDVIAIGRYWLWGSVAMTVLIVLQFTSPQSAWVNQGVGGMEGAGFSGALGKYRPPGTFSFIIGVVQFYTFTTAFLISGVTQHRRYGKLLLTAASIALIMAIPVSISRSLMLSVAITLMAGILTATFQSGSMARFFRIALIGCAGIYIAGQFPVFDDAKSAFLARWERSTGESKGGVSEAIIGRTVNEFIGPFTEQEDIPFLGMGLGAGTQVGAKLLTGEKGFELGEGEWFRLTAEGGLILGTLYITWRVWLTFALAKFGLFAFRKGNGMGLIFLSATAYNLLIGQFGQSTIGGFTVIGIGLTIASMRLPKTKASTRTTHEQSQNQSAS